MLLFFFPVWGVYLISISYHYNFLCQQVGVGRRFGVHMYLSKPWRLGAMARDNFFFYIYIYSNYPQNVFYF